MWIIQVLSDCITNSGNVGYSGILLLELYLFIVDIHIFTNC